jgi:gamma-glutamylcyclotransferase (GGCT)/AIG2-like uncharacterized protein YtfP
MESAMMRAQPDADKYLPIFVYGTLRPGQENYDRFVLGKTAREVPAVLPAHAMFVLGGYPCITEDAGLGDVIGDVLYLLPELFPKVLAALDQLEGYVPGDPSSPYLRVRCSVRTGDGGEPPHASLAWVYVAGEPALLRRPACVPVPGGNWLAYLAHEHS